MKPLQWQNQRGASLIIIVAMLLIIGMVGAALVSLVSNESFTAMNQSAGLLTFGITDGGVEYEQYRLAQDVDWYHNTSDPILIFTRTLGAAPNSGSFTAQANLPATKLRTRIPDGVTTAAICVYTTDRFPTSGYLQIGDDGQDPFEFVHYTNVAVAGCGAQFTGILRGQSINGVPSTAGAHARRELVYPVTTLGAALASNCTALPSLQITDNQKFLTAGTLSILTDPTPGSIDWEEIGYTGSTRALGVMTLLGVSRCQNGTAPAAFVQNAGNPITPILSENPPAAPDFLAEIVSTGTVAVTITGNAVRVIRKTVQR